jgi:predicted transposase YdaD
MASGNYECQSDFARKCVAQGEAKGKAEGKAEGRAEGRAEGKAEAVLMVLASRKLEVSEPQRERILTCVDVDALDRWLGRVVTVSSVAELLAD